MNTDERQHMIDLMIKSWANDLSEEEQEEYKNLQHHPFWNQLKEELQDDDYLLKRFREYEQYLSVSDYSAFLLQIKKQKQNKKEYAIRLWAGCAACLAIVLGISFFLHKNPSSPQPSLQEVHPFRMTEQNAVKLIIAQGEEITLNTGIIPQLDTLGIKVENQIKTLSYLNLSGSSETETGHHTLVVPKGNIYKLILADSSRVILNADSKITYPTHFQTGKERHIKIEGEAYFEVKHDTTSPFIVEGRNFKVNVLGTTFNINSYENETVSYITLISGSIQMQTANATVKLHPREMFSLDQNNQYEIRNVDWNMVISWIHHKFCFNRSSLEEIMRKISRWYGVDIVYDTSVIQGHFTGTVPTDFKLEELLELLSSTTDITLSIRNGVVYVK